MKLTRLRIRQLPGIDDEFTLDDLEPGINLVTGPNAIGKSSLIRALRYLVSEPASTDPAALTLEADFENGGHWRVSRTGQGYEWRHDGARAERPALPDRDALHCYWLTMENLVRGEEDAPLIEQLRKALAGGYDLSALRAGDFELRPRVGISEGTRLMKAKREQRQIESEYRDLTRREARLPDLDKSIERAHLAGSRAEQLKQALALTEILAEGRKIQAAFDAFPPYMAKLRGNELERLDHLEQERESLERESESVRRSRQDAEVALRETGLLESRPDRTELEVHRKRLDEVEHRREQLDAQCKMRDQAQAEEDRARQSLGGHDHPPQLEPEVIGRAEQLADELNRRKLQRDDIEARIPDADEVPDESELTRHQLAIQALHDWLAARQGSGENPLPVILAGLAGVVALVISVIEREWVTALAATTVVGATAWSLLRKKSDRTGGARRTFERQNLEGPVSWERDSVAAALDTLQQRYDTLRMTRTRALAAERDRERLQRLEKELAQLEQRKQQLAAEIGFDPSLTALGVDHFVRQVEGYQRARHQREESEITIRRLQKEIRESLESVQEFMSRWGVHVAASHAELDAALTDLADRTRRADQALAAMQQKDTDLERLQSDRDKQVSQIMSLYREAGLYADGRSGLETGIDQLDAYKDVQRRLQENTIRESERREALADEPALIKHAESRERDILEAERDKALETAAELDALRDERADINARVRNAGDDRLLEKAGAEVEDARAELEERMNNQLFAEAGQFLLDDVEGEHRTEHEPEVLRDARERFRRFTHHAWDVDLSDNRLRARDCRQNILRELSELSSGTRMQLLLAVRLAWTRRLEQSRESLPLFLDEALTTADEERFKAVAESLETLAAEEGRQIFYLSARRQEVSLWEKVTGHRPHHVDLGGVRRLREGAAPEDYVIRDDKPLPEPEDKPPEVYAAELGVPNFAPMREATELHLFHLLRDDLRLLHRLMRDWRVITLGQLEALLDSASARNAIPDEQERRRLRGRCRAADAWVHAWRRGRGKPVDRIVLEQSGAVSNNYIEAVTALSEETGGDANAIIDALNARAVSGFRAQKIEDLEEYLEENGYVSGEETLDAGGRERQTLMTAGNKADPVDIRRLVQWLEAACAGAAGSL